jgi:cytochrome d ubiquinol oxidase subunit II
MSLLQVTWFCLIGVLLTGYAILDGFDLGVGFWHLFTKKDRDRRTLLRAIEPVWDGNEVWLLTGGGALFAAFPHVYATVFSGFYLAMMLVVFGLVFRGVAVHFRSKTPSIRWQRSWDSAFAVGSILPGLLFGVAVGNILRGLPLDSSKTYIGSFFDLLNPYALLVGIFGLSMFAMHGAFFIQTKTEGELAERARRWGQVSWVVFLVLFLVTTIATVTGQSQLLGNFRSAPVLWVIPVLTVILMLTTGLFAWSRAPVRAFLGSSLTILGLMATGASSLFPKLVPAVNGSSLSLTVSNASSSELTLKVMLILALIGMPIVLGYTVWVYRTFAGKVSLEEEGY